MERQIATTQEQSTRLLRCGVSADTADMSIRTITEPMIRDVAERETPLLLTMSYSSAKDIYRGDYVQPAWSLSALLGLLPKTIGDFWMTKWYAPNVDGFEIDDIENPYQLSGDFQLLHIGGGNYQVEYDWVGFRGKLPQSDNPIEACVLAIELLVANDYKFNGTNENEQ